MTVEKITSPITPLEEIDKINEIIDNLGGSAPSNMVTTDTAQDITNRKVFNIPTTTDQTSYTGYLEGTQQTGSGTFNWSLGGFTSSTYERRNGLVFSPDNNSAWAGMFISSSVQNALQNATGVRFCGTSSGYAMNYGQVQNTMQGGAHSLIVRNSDGLTYDGNKVLDSSCVDGSTITFDSTTGKISSVGGAHFNLLEFKWCDHLLNDVSWLRADTFSWQSGDVYVTAYNHLVDDIEGITAETETIGSYTVTFYRAADGHKICLADQENTVLNIYNETGIAWYYILDTTNTQFKLPRTKYGFEGLRNNVGDLIPQDVLLPNITGNFGLINDKFNYLDGVFGTATTSTRYTNGLSSSGNGTGRVNFNASRSSSVYSGNGSNTNIQERATQMYLYFYVGDYTQTAIEQTAGLNAELFNGKADLNLANTTNKLADGFLSKLTPDYENGITTSFPTYPLSSSTVTFTCPSAGFFDLVAVSTAYFTINIYINNNLVVSVPAPQSMSCTAQVLVDKGDIIRVNSDSTGNTWQIIHQYFFPLKGAN